MSEQTTAGALEHPDAVDATRGEGGGGAVTALDEYREHCRNMRFGAGHFSTVNRDRADAAIAELLDERDALYERRLPYREAEVAQARYEKAEAELAKLGECTLGVDAELAAVGSDLQDEVEYTITLRERAERAEAALAEIKQERKELRVAIRNLANDFNDLGERCGAAESALATARASVPTAARHDEADRGGRP